MALYRLRKWITPSINGNKINRNVFKALYLEQNGMMAGIYRVMDMLSLSSLSFYFVSLPLLHSPPSLALSPTESGWPGMSSPTDGTASHSQTGAVSQGSTTGSISTLFKFMGTFENHSFQKIDRWLLSVTVLITVKSSWVQQPNQLVRSDALLCLFHLATPAIIFNLKRSVNNLVINCT